MKIQYDIVTEIAARLGNISTANGYNTTIGGIFISRRNPLEDDEPPAARIMFGGVSPAQTVAAKRYGRETHDLSVSIEYYVPKGLRDFFEVSLEAGMDVWTAIYRATTAPQVSDPVSFQLGGMVPRLGLLSFNEVLVDQQSIFGGADIELGISYDVDPSDPFTMI